MRRALIGILAVIGGFTVLGTLVGFVMHRYIAEGSTTGIVLGPDNKPAVGAPVFLDRGDATIERFVTDSQGRFSLKLQGREARRAKWLICVPGGIPMVGYSGADGFQIGPTTYGFTAQPAGKPTFHPNLRLARTGTTRMSACARFYWLEIFSRLRAWAI